MVYQDSLKTFLKVNRIHVLRDATLPIAMIEGRCRIVYSINAQTNQEVLDFLHSKNATWFRLYKIKGKMVRFAYL